MTQHFISEQSPKFLKREIFLGEDERLIVEMALVSLPNETWVLLREASCTRAASQLPVLTGGFEYIATVLRHELVYLKKHSQDLRFFHVAYEMAPTGTVRWGVKEVELLLRWEQYVFARWHVPDPAVQDLLTATLNSWAPPQRTTR